ncbi:MAG: FG-GAP repeat protein [Pyrinomonadaceae bacterium]
MNRIKNSVINFFGMFVVVSALVLMPIPTSHGQFYSMSQRKDQQSQTLLRDALAQNVSESRVEEALFKQQDGDEEGINPCDHQPLGNAFGRSRRCPPRGSSAGVAKGDFNGDGFADLAVGVPLEDVGRAKDAGAVNVIYGSVNGLTSAGNQFFTENGLGGLNLPTFANHFGAALASGDFNGDRYSDLAIGIPDEDLQTPTGTISDVGAVLVLYGSERGLTDINAQGFRGVIAAGHLGQALAWGDFNADSIGDLAIGTPGRDIGSALGAGSVTVFYGSATGLSSASGQFWAQHVSDGNGTILDFAETGDNFGASLTAGDFNGDGASDLAVGVLSEDETGFADAGAVNIIYGRAGSGLTTLGNQILRDTILPIAVGDNFGRALTAGDFNGDRFDDLAVGIPLRDIGTATDAGAVVVEYGTSNGLAESGVQVWTQDSPGVVDGAETGDQFGLALAAGDLNGDGRKDLAIGAPFEDFPITGTLQRVDAGIVHVFYGASGGLTANLSQQFNTGVGGERFGSALTAWDFGNGPQADLAVGVPSWNVGSIAGAGAVNVFYGTADGVTFTGHQVWTQDSTNILDVAESGDQFGSALY